MDASYYSARIVRLLALHTRAHLGVSDAALDTLCDSGESLAGDVYLAGEFKRLAGRLLTDVFFEGDVLNRLIGGNNVKSIDGYTDTEYVLCEGALL